MADEEPAGVITCERRDAGVPAHVGVQRQILACIDQSRPIGVRDTAIILLGYAGALRRSELAGLSLADIVSDRAGLILTLRRSMTDQDGCGNMVGVARGRHSDKGPVAAVDAWLALRSHKVGLLFTRVLQPHPRRAAYGQHHHQDDPRPRPSS